MISGAVILLCRIELMTIVCLGVEAGLSRKSLEKDSAQGLRAGIGVKFHHGVRMSIADLQDRRGTHAVLLYFKGTLLVITPFKELVLPCQLGQQLSKYAETLD